MFLRPEFTKDLATLLITGSCVNLISPHGQGRRRTLQDLSVILSSVLDIQQFDLRQQPDLEAVITNFLNCKKPSLLILHNFDCLVLQSLKTQLKKINSAAKLSLLCVSELEEKQPILTMKNIKLPAVTQEQLITEVKQRNLDTDLSAKQIVLWLQQQDSPYSLLDQMHPLDLVRNCSEAGQDKSRTEG